MEIPLTQQEIIEYNNFIWTFFIKEKIPEIREMSKTMTDDDINNLSFDENEKLTPTQIRAKLEEFRRLKKQNDDAERNIDIDKLDFGQIIHSANNPNNVF